jgi:hypothetical protein
MRPEDFNEENEEDFRNIPFISVIDCVGKIAPKSSFDRVLR